MEIYFKLRSFSMSGTQMPTLRIFSPFFERNSFAYLAPFNGEFYRIFFCPMLCECFAVCSGTIRHRNVIFPALQSNEHDLIPSRVCISLSGNFILGIFPHEIYVYLLNRLIFTCVQVWRSRSSSICNSARNAKR